MQSVKNIVRLCIYLNKLSRSFNEKSIYNLLFIYYLFIKLINLLKMQLKVCCIPDELFVFLVMKHGKCNERYVDKNLYVLCNSNEIDMSKKWFYLCHKVSKRKYKVAVIHTNDILENNIYVSESMKMNINKYLNVEKSNTSSYFLIPVIENSTIYATEVKISLILNPNIYTDELMKNLLQQFFLTPKYVRLYDIFSINIKKFIPETKYYTAYSKFEILHCKVTDIKTESDNFNEDGCFVIYGRTSLFQESNINSYIPCKCFCDLPFCTMKYFNKTWPPALNKQFQQIQCCIAPFLQKDIYIKLNPVFLLEGPAGSGKSRLAKTAAQALGLHLVEADFAEVQSLSSAQTEAKLRIILSEAESCIPCILLFKNIQIFGMNSEGQKDERVLSAFRNELKKLYSKALNFPIIIIATSDELELPIDAERTFVDKICFNYLEQEQICDLLPWLIKSKSLKHKINFQKIAKMCSGFVLSDLEALVLYAIKNCFKHINLSQKNENVMELSNEDFIQACEHMQSIFSDQIGAPRIPKVYWEDIGGLADLKREIMRRIEMPLLNIPGMGRSGLLLYGPPGTGKTLLAKAVATECQLHFLSVKGPELLNMYVGQSEKNVRQVFERARAAAPCIIFFDELDSLAPNRGQSGDSGGVMDRVVSQLLAEMDGLESSGNVFIVAATNRPDLIDPALLRPGRFDKMLYVGIYSDANSQMSVLRALTKKFRIDGRAELLEELVGKLPGDLTGADLYSVCSNAWLAAVRRTLNAREMDRDKVTAEDVIVQKADFMLASRDLVPSVSRDEIVRYERLKDELSPR